MRYVIVGWFVALAGVQTSAAQAPAGIASGPFWERPLYIGGNVGLNVPTGQYGQAFDPGWAIGLNAAWPFTPHHGAWLQADIGYAASSMTSATVASYGASAGHSNVTSGTLNVVLNKRDYFGNFTPYIVFGGGAYWRSVSLDNYTGTSYCNAFVGFCGVYGTTPATRSRTQFVPGGDAGGGIRYRVPPFRISVEARYNTIATRHGNTDFVPVVLGVEW